MSVKRYDCSASPRMGGGMEAHELGDYVLHSDYAALEKDRDELRAALRAEMRFLGLEMLQPQTRDLLLRLGDLEKTEECNQCGLKREDWQGEQDNRCPNQAHPDRSCDGELKPTGLKWRVT